MIFLSLSAIYDVQEWKLIAYEGLFRTEKLIISETTFHWFKKE